MHARTTTTGRLGGAVVAVLGGWLTVAEPTVFSVRDYGAVGDGVVLDTAAIQRAVDACAAAGAGQVRFPPGRYRSGTVHLRSHMTLWLEAGAVLVGSTNLADYCAPSRLPPGMPEARWGKWHRALLMGEGVEEVTLAGAGLIDGQKVFDPAGEERMRGPHTILLAGARRCTLRDLTVRDSANYAVLFFVSDDVEVRNMKFTGGWDGVHFRGTPERPCRGVSILDCQFYTGDDCIAGRYWDRVVISGCVVNSSCNGIRVIGPAQHLIVRDCLFYGPGVEPHRTSGRHNMLSGILLQPGAWDPTRGTLDDVLIAEVTMKEVASPVNLWMQEGNTVGSVTVAQLTATGVYRSAISVESFAGAPITNVVLRGVQVEFVGGGTTEQGLREVKAPGVDARSLPAWGIYAKGVERLLVEDVRVACSTQDFRPVVIAEEVGRLTLDGLRHTRVPGVTEPVRLRRVGRVEQRGVEMPWSPTSP